MGLAAHDIVAGFGLVLLLGAFILNAAGRMDRSAAAYHGMNAVGAGILAWYAVIQATPVFVLLEATWATVAAVSLVARVSTLRGRRKELRNRRVLS
jgi:peptidoglycan/LPS O-acetylase OafA/YrhL